jgi:hypothetical protein
LECHNSFPGVQFLACISEALRAIFITAMQASRPEGFNLAETLQHLCLANTIILLSMSAVFEGKHVLEKCISLQPLLLLITAISSVLTDLTCFLSLRVRKPF